MATTGASGWRRCCAALVLLAVGVAHAGHAAADSPGSGYEFGLKVTSLGVGIELRRDLGAGFAVRGVVNTYRFVLNEERNDVRYDGWLRLSSGGLLVDWQPAASGFRITGGFLLNDNRLKIEARPQPGTFRFNGRLHSTAEIGTASGRAEFAIVSPYLGVGYRRAFSSAPRVSLMADLGVLVQGKPNYRTTVVCGTGVPAAVCLDLQSDIETERRRFARTADRTAYYPVVSVGLAYRFGGD